MRTNILSIDGEMSRPIQWCPFSEIVSPLSPDPQPAQNVSDHSKFQTTTKTSLIY